ncbi:MAG: hypothetical protein Q4F71_08730, partial [Paracoccus sp. (in: a-proteobacteria)]|nr:hypothetical protein [Paracoccus sp. (in: a-proteobacteria)]
MPRHPRAQAIAPLFAGIAALGLAAPASALLINDVPDDRVLACQADPGLQGCSTVLTGIYVCENAAEMEGCAEVLQRLAVLNGDVEPEDEAMTQAELETAVEPRAEGELAEDLDEDDLTPAELAQQDDDEEREGDAGLVAGGSEGGSADGGSGQGAPDGLASNGALPSTHDAPAGTAEATEQQAPGLADEPEETIAPQTPERAAEPGSAPA